VHLNSYGVDMKFIEMTGKQLNEIVNDDELQVTDLEGAGVTEESIVRVNQHGDIEVRRPAKWDVIGGLLGGFEDRVKRTTGFEWA
ncbi:MAG: hypothetical protein VX768_14795, partial [Planctomycetota bacterium]|nr:hypothetical protein [Planctomycetota bacterium]